MKTIAFLGIGAMGHRIATHLLAAGYPLQIWNRTPERYQSLVEQGAIAYPSPREAVQGVDVAIAMVADDVASRQVWLAENTGAIYGLAKEAIALEYSTLTPTWCQTLAEYLGDVGIHFLDAPVVGTRPQAESQSLIHLVGGNPEVLAQVKPILEVASGAIHPMGAIGMGMTMKLVVNALFGIQVAALGEVLGVLNQAGLSPEMAIALLNQMPTTSPALAGIGRLIAGKTFAPLFPIDLVVKDLGYLQDLARIHRASLPLLVAAQACYHSAQEQGYGADNIAGVAQLYV